MANSDHFGCVYYDPEFRFKDGKVKEKRFVVLCSSPMTNSEVVVVRTTSQERGSRKYGCQLNDRYQVFFMPLESEKFPKDTWIMLDYTIEYDAGNLGTRLVPQKAKLKPRAYGGLLACASQARDVERDIRNAISQRHISEFGQQTSCN